MRNVNNSIENIKYFNQNLTQQLPNFAYYVQLVIHIKFQSGPAIKKMKLSDATVPRAPGSPGALIQMQIKRSIFKIYHLDTPCFRNDLCPIATNAVLCPQLNSNLVLIIINVTFDRSLWLLNPFRFESKCRLGPFRANFEYPGVLPIRLREASLLGFSYKIV